MRIDKTYSKLWNLVNEYEDESVRETAQMALNTLQKLQEENVQLQNNNIEFEAYRKCVRGEI
ncbi:hypothetical protein BTR22_18500 [Alkalihalophilus pseudofirmus]|uniref:hypothetical protein n=1 Tax=Alkalihalophilus pseudofirmus TaxID=79885 RepID=UPI0009514BBA|nr:hypothetical protein BTR22_18500 [Alkalihalophilus pseudofirmus]